MTARFEEPTPLRRRRVAEACQKCRQLKSKCDGVHPSCGRCTAYGYNCVWVETKGADSGPTLSGLLDAGTFKEPVDLLYPLVKYLRPLLDRKDRRSLDKVYATVVEMRRHEQAESILTENSGKDIIRADCFHGEASGEAFIDDVYRDGKRLYDEESIDRSYDPENRHVCSMPELSFPNITEQEGIKYMNIYAATIGVTYPFLVFDRLDTAVREWIRNPLSNNLSTNWQSVVLAVLAIGSCYETLSSDAPDEQNLRTKAKHKILFDCSLNISTCNHYPRNLERVWARLTQCFYLLATSQIDRCWTNLGQAVRLAHGIGLHVERASSNYRLQPVLLRVQRQATWYSVYILDHLLALQLGRPPAIYSPFFSVHIPCELVLSQEDATLSALMGEPAEQVRLPVQEYFQAMIRFSDIIEGVMQSLYAPLEHDAIDRCATMADLDSRLQSWRMGLPRRLRFDLGHVFESSALYRRHRNYLAIKYHNLRSLIHRPSLSYLMRNVETTQAENLAAGPVLTIQHSTRICVESAQSTAQLLYDVKDKEYLVHNFPWWQMISCLICASSILLVAITDGRLSTGFDKEGLQQDVIVCLEVFKVLGANSKTAESALALLRNLQTTRESHNANGSSSSRTSASLHEFSWLNWQHGPISLEDALPGSFDFLEDIDYDASDLFVGSQASNDFVSDQPRG